MLLQRTRADTVERFLPNFYRRFPSWWHLAEAQESELQKFLEPIGLSHRRAASFNALAKEIVSRNGHFPFERSEIEALPGVGQYIANAILLMAHGKREPLLDVNMARVVERYFGPRKLADIRYDPYLQKLARRVSDHDSPKEINWAILDLAAKICTPRHPHCENCPLKLRCRFAPDVFAEGRDSTS
ncbi:hypothetical protein [Pelagibius sp. CAU 1746]|uniref:hypothetical protein n=1 Tax=Pelagibius sp. CAU 1746 TaxID=3140370 RepID=UPI003460BF2F